MKKTVLICSLLLMVSTLAAAATGISGRVAWHGELIEGVTIRAYRTVADLVADKPVAVSQATLTDGTYQLNLPPGRYLLTARDFDGEPQAGRYFCYYNGSPVQVVAGRQTRVGFNLIRIPEPVAVESEGRSGLKGVITFQGEPLEKSYLYVYKDADKGFKGPPYFIQPVADGNFRLRLPPGDYFLLARKRAKGGQFGPIEIGDYFNYYYGNPVRLNKGEIRYIDLETVSRLSMLEEGEPLPLQGVRGEVLDADGRPVSGVHVFAYRDAAMTKSPDFFSAMTQSDGRFELSLPELGTWYLLARENFGGPAAEGENYGRYQADPAHAVRLEADSQPLEIIIHVQPQTP
ncbi:MAG: carboxypeptidase regulatory-like domain-containing protein [Desulfuromonadales bacterium]|nr:carboxypeptidase regulatory-like domain-containing protein [Desulfuromonadales bacterium]